jgi:hypothetical protein
MLGARRGSYIAADKGVGCGGAHLRASTHFGRVLTHGKAHAQR